jgi:DNA mismatch endonuclease (patch repair protein)
MPRFAAEAIKTGQESKEPRNRSPEMVSAIMRSIRSKNTRPELAVRQVLRKLGVSYRLHRRDLPGRPDIAMIGRRKAIFVHGCFWHQHNDRSCPLVKRPRVRTNYWNPKFERIAARDAQALEDTASAGWTVLVLWECQLNDVVALERRLRDFLDS